MPVERTAATYADVKEAVEQREAEYGGHPEFVWTLQKPHKNATFRIWYIAVNWEARRGNHAGRVYHGECQIGGARGAASAPGAMLRALLDLDEDVDRLGALTQRPLPLVRLPS